MEEPQQFVWMELGVLLLLGSLLTFLAMWGLRLQQKFRRRLVQVVHLIESGRLDEASRVGTELRELVRRCLGERTEFFADATRALVAVHQARGDRAAAEMLLLSAWASTVSSTSSANERFSSERKY